jgi:hypothetical protein
MNNLLKLDGTFEQRASSAQPHGSRLPNGKAVDIAHMQELQTELQALYDFWSKETLIDGALVNVLYPKVIAKSNRIKVFFSNGKYQANDSIVGARFQGSSSENHKHVITHFISLQTLKAAKDMLDIAIDIVKNKFNNLITSKNIDDLIDGKIEYKNTKITKSKFINIIVDAFHVEKFSIPNQGEEIPTINTDSAIITIYKTGIQTSKLLETLGITLFPINQWDDTTLLLKREQFEYLKNKVPYLIAMSVTDLSQFSKDDFNFHDGKTLSIPDPKNEPVIGVIDKLFDTRVYFSKWVENHVMIDSTLPIDNDDYFHGTAVSSIIVDGPSFNPTLDDGCGRFRVRHFGVAVGKRFSSFRILKSIERIIQENRDIHVWNLSLGSTLEVNQNFISPEAAILDRIQYENNVIFVIAGTNKQTNDDKKTRIGAPADSINSIVVNSVNKQGLPASYSRYGTVLSFFNKPDCCYFGGDGNEYIQVCTSTGAASVRGTSFAAPWISRKVAYLIEVMGLSRESAKALLIDSAAGWSNNNTSPQLLGYGIVPTRIEDIMQTKDDEIRFIITGVSEKYDTYNYKLPVPIYKDKYPFIARATLCYFPFCSRNQGVDYTLTELDFYFGRIKGNTIKSINDNKQSIDKINYITEEDARKYYRKWDNVKHINETLKTHNKSKKVYDNKMWGISIKTKERVNKKNGKGIKFSIVVTLKELNGVNRIEDFIQQCSFKEWIVHKLDINNKIDIYNKAETEINFSDD